jgi:NADPH:quinone reductase-like Zn-dependent oxidoreductase
VFGTAKGSFAQYVRAAEERLVPRPSNVTAVQAAVVPVSATAALQAVRDKGRVRPGQRVLVIGASGGVGLYAVQIARASGAEVTGVASGSKADLVRAAGADRVVDYERHDLADLAGEFDVVVDIAGNRQLSVLRRLLTPTGTLVITGGEHNGAWFGGIGRNMRAQLLSPFVRQRLVAFVSRLRHADLVTLAAMLEDGRLVPNVDRTFALTSAADAVSYLAEGRARGKVAVTV